VPRAGSIQSVATTQGSWRARNVVLATDDYRKPEQLSDGAVLIVGTGQSGGQIAEELLIVAGVGRDAAYIAEHNVAQ
jgi:putative flavoprotein involved in K+ transport